MSKRGILWVLGLVMGCADPEPASSNSDGGLGDAPADTTGTMSDGAATDTAAMPSDTAPAGDTASAGAWVAVPATSPPTKSTTRAHVGTADGVILAVFDNGGTLSYGFNGAGWDSHTVPADLKGVGCAGSGSLGGVLMLYSGCSGMTPDLKATWTGGIGGWTKKTSGGRGRNFMRIAPNPAGGALVVGGMSTTGAAAESHWSWNGGWLSLTAPSKILDDTNFTLFNIGTNVYAQDASGTYRWGGAEWILQSPSGSPPPPSGDLVPRWTTDGARVLLISGSSIYSFDDKSWSVLPGGVPCDSDRNAVGLGTIGGKFYLFCAPTSVDAKWITYRWTGA